MGRVGKPYGYVAPRPEPETTRWSRRLRGMEPALDITDQVELPREAAEVSLEVSTVCVVDFLSASVEESELLEDLPIAVSTPRVVEEQGPGTEFPFYARYMYPFNRTLPSYYIYDFDYTDYSEIWVGPGDASVALELVIPENPDSLLN